MIDNKQTILIVCNDCDKETIKENKKLLSHKIIENYKKLWEKPTLLKV